MCKDCKNSKCSLAGKYVPYMDGKKNKCLSNPETREERDYQTEWFEAMRKQLQGITII